MLHLGMARELLMEILVAIFSNLATFLLMETTLDLEYIKRQVGDIGAFLEICPNPNSSDIGKMMSIQGAVLQREGLALMAEAAQVENFNMRVRRLAVAADLLSRAESALMRADVILAREVDRVGRVSASESRMRELLEARRIANGELLEQARAEGLMISISSRGEVRLRAPRVGELLDHLAS